jgi:hypothetical protein
MPYIVCVHTSKTDRSSGFLSFFPLSLSSSEIYPSTFHHLLPSTADDASFPRLRGPKLAQYASVVNSATARLIQCAEKVSTYFWKAPLHGSLDGTSTIRTKLVEWPVVESRPARTVVL